MSAYEYRMQAIPLERAESGWTVKVWVRKFSEDPADSAWSCVVHQVVKHLNNGDYPSLYWKAIVKQIAA